MAAPPSADELIDAILAEKGPAVYKDGLSEDNWEEVSVFLDWEMMHFVYSVSEIV